MAIKKKNNKKPQYFVETLKLINKKLSKNEDSCDNITFENEEFVSNNNFYDINPSINTDYVFLNIENTCSLLEFSYDNFISEVDSITHDIENEYYISFNKQELEIIEKELLEFNYQELNNRTWIAMVNPGYGQQYFSNLLKEGKVVFLGSYQGTRKVYMYGSKNIKNG